MSEKNITGKVEIGDEVRTLNHKRAVYGIVTEINRWKKKDWAKVVGHHYPGGPVVETRANVDDLAITRKDTDKLWLT